MDRDDRAPQVRGARRQADAQPERHARRGRARGAPSRRSATSAPRRSPRPTYSRSLLPGAAQGVHARPASTLNARVRDITGHGDEARGQRPRRRDLVDLAGRRRGSRRSGRSSCRSSGSASKSGYSTQAVFVTAQDVNGKPIEGLKVDVAWPTSTGHAPRAPVHRRARATRSGSGRVGKSPKLTPLDVVATATVRGQVTSTHAWWAITPVARDRAARASRRRSATRPSCPGQTVTVTSIAHDAQRPADPQPARPWTWNFNGKKVTTKGITDANGRASSSQLITTSTTTDPGPRDRPHAGGQPQPLHVRGLQADPQ